MLRFVDYKSFARFLLLTISSSSIVFFTNPEFLTIGGIISLISLSVLVSFSICSISYLLRRTSRLRKTFELICYLIISLILIVDVFLYINFGIVIDETVFTILEGTNMSESKDFLLTYTNFKTFCAIGLLAVFFFAVFYFTSFINEAKTRSLGVIILVLLVLSLTKLSVSIYTTLKYDFGGHLAAYSTYSRIARSGLIYYNISKETNRLIDNLQEWTGDDVTNATQKCNKMVVIIGESYSKYHSQLYGYEKETSPLLAKRVEEGNLILYSDVITPINDTERSFRAVYSLGEYYNDVYSDCLLFPYVFKKSGYYTINVDNLDLASNTNRVKDSKKLSDFIFDFRNATTSQYDDEVLQWLDIDEDKYPQQLFVIKLKGQHYDYANQFPASFAKYQVEDYDRTDLPDNKVQLIADYDNATIFNDYVVNSIIEYFEEDNSVIIYFSDHGEEVFDERDYMGHGGTTPYLNYQVEIPFMIWMSDSYRMANSSVVQNIIANRDLPYTTDDVSHTILDMAGIGCPQFVPERSLANDEFDSRESRVVMRSFVYEELNTLRQL